MTTGRVADDPHVPNAASVAFRAGWNFADIWEAHADRFPDAPALVHGATRVSFARFDARADGVAAALIGAGLVQQDKVAQYPPDGWRNRGSSPSRRRRSCTAPVRSAR